MGYSAQSDNEIYNPWTIVNLVFHHLVDEGLHPILGDSGNPGEPAAALLAALGVEPVVEGSRSRQRADAGAARRAPRGRVRRARFER
jgi:hypothetical protein